MEFITDLLRFKYAKDERPVAGMFSKHAHQQYEFLYLLDGEVQCIIEQKMHRLKKGELIVIPPLHYHFIRILQPAPYERIVLNFSSTNAPRQALEQLFREPRIIKPSEEKRIGEVFERFVYYIEEFEGDDRKILTENLLTELILLLNKKGADQGFTAYHNELMEQALRYIDKHLTEIRTADEISAALFISRSRLYNAFQEAFGIPPMKYINEKRLLFAAARIQVGEKPASAASACGFGDYSVFYRAYKKRFGISPSQHRKSPL